MVFLCIYGHLFVLKVFFPWYLYLWKGCIFILVCVPALLMSFPLL